MPNDKQLPKYPRRTEVVETETATVDTSGNMQIRFTFEAAVARKKPAKLEDSAAQEELNANESA